MGRRLVDDLETRQTEIEIKGDVGSCKVSLGCKEEKMNTTRLKVSKLASRYNFSATAAPITCHKKGKLLNRYWYSSSKGGIVSQEGAVLICEGSLFGSRENVLRCSGASMGLYSLAFRSYSKDSKNHSSATANNQKVQVIRNLLLLSLFTCACGGTILLWSYWRLRDTFMRILGNSESKTRKKYLYPFDPSDAKFFIKKHCMRLIPPKYVTSPAAWKLSQEIQRGGSEREIAIAKLSNIQNLTDSDCLHFALTLDLPTSFALAHNGADVRLFIPPPICAAPSEGFKTYLGEMFRKVLSACPEENIHENLNYLYKTTLRAYLPTEEEQQQHNLDMYTGFDEVPMWYTNAPEITESRVLKVCLQATISHTRDPSQLKYLPKGDLLDLLVVIAERCKADKEIMSLVLKVLANVSCDQNFAEDIQKNGCLRILVECASDRDVRLTLPAKRALHNLDKENSKHILPSGIYQLYPDFRTDDSVLEYDVIFIHGILGGAFRTWRQQDKDAGFEDESNIPEKNTRNDKVWTGEKSVIASKFIFKTPVEHPDEAKRYKIRTEEREGIWMLSDEEIDLDKEHEDSPETQCWPRDWLPQDCPNARIIAVDFDSFVTHWSGFCPVETTKRSLNDRAEELLEKLYVAGVGERPIIWITHSMGGLLAKSILCQAAISRKEYESICKKTKGVVFCSVPHSGSYIALANTPRRYIFMPTEEALELTNSDNNLTLLHERFKRLWRAFRFKVLSFGEMLETKSVFKVAFKMVPFSSADPEIGEFYPVKLNHLNTCKPHCRGSFVYKKIVEFIHRATRSIDS